MFRSSTLRAIQIGPFPSGCRDVARATGGCAGRLRRHPWSRDGYERRCPAGRHRDHHQRRATDGRYGRHERVGSTKDRLSPAPTR